MFTRAIPLVLALGCTTHVRRAEEQTIDLAQTWEATEGVEAQPRWWAAFGDPALDRMADALLEQNLDLKAAWERISQARAGAAQAGSARYPQVTASAGASASRVHVPIAPTGAIEPDIAENYSLSVGASYEVDVWGRIEALVDAADAEVEAATFDRQALALSLTASLADTWFALVEQNAQKALLAAQLEVSQTLYDLLRLRFANGLATAVDVLQQEALLKSVKAQQPLVDGRLALFRHRIALLLGRQTNASDARLAIPVEQTDLPALPTRPGAGVPSELLARRPDIRAARRRLVAADHRVAAAMADRFPSIRIDATTGFRAQSLSDLVDRWVWSLAGNLVAPLVDGGRRAAVVEQRQAALREGMHRLAASMLTALREVADAVVQESRQQQHVGRLDSQLSTSRSLFEESRARYLDGVGDYLPVLNALRSLQQLEQNRLSAQRQLLSHRIQLHRAIAGELPLGEMK